MFPGAAGSGLARKMTDLKVIEPVLLAFSCLGIIYFDHMGNPVLIGMKVCTLDKFMDRM